MTKIRLPIPLLPLLLLVGLLLYLPTLKAKFVYDDFWFIVHNPALAAVTPRAFFGDPRTIAAPESGLDQDVYRPMVALSFAIDRAGWGLRPFPYHFENLLLHLLNTALLFALLRRLFRNVECACVAAAVFCLHPVQVQTVAWISQRSILLSSLGGLGALVLWEQEAPDGLGSLLGGLALFAVALGSRETALIFPGIALLLDLRRSRKAFSRDLLRTHWIKYAGMAVLSIGYLLWRQHLLHHLSQFEGKSFGSYQDLMLGFMAFSTYLGKLVMPVKLRPSYDYPLMRPYLEAGAAALFLGYLSAIRWTRERSALSYLGLSWLLLGLMPVLQIIPIRAFFAERFLYFALIGFAIVIGSLWMRSKQIRGPIMLWGVSCMVITALSVPAWKNEVALWSDAIRKDPSNAFAQSCYAEAVAASEPAEAEIHYKIALSDHPSDDVQLAAMNNLAQLYLRGQKPRIALEWAIKAKQMGPDNPHVLYNLKMIQDRLKKEEAGT